MGSNCLAISFKIKFLRTHYMFNISYKKKHHGKSCLPCVFYEILQDSHPE